MDRLRQTATMIALAVGPFLLLVYILTHVDTPVPIWSATVFLAIVDRVFGGLGFLPPAGSWAAVGLVVGAFTYLAVWELRELNRPYLRVGLLILPWILVLSIPGAWSMLDIHVSHPGVIQRADEVFQPGEVRSFYGIEFVWIPAGQFRMGSPDTEPDRRADETAHMVTISHGFWMGRYEVTRAQWYAAMKKIPEDYNEETDANMPMTGITWNDCQSFITTLNQNRDGGFRMPTEAEWEHACRAGGTTVFSCGDSSSCLAEHAWYRGNSENKVHPVGKQTPNTWGLYDMHGNVWEWCRDHYGEYPQRRIVDPTGPATGQYTVLRGGSWFSTPEECRSARRFVFVPGYFSDRSVMGFRLARTNNPPRANNPARTPAAAPAQPYPVNQPQGTGQAMTAIPGTRVQTPAVPERTPAVPEQTPATPEQAPATP